MTDTVSVWLVDRTYSDDEQNLLIFTYATADGQRAFRRELAVTTMRGLEADPPARVEVAPENLSTVVDPETVAWYRSAVAERRDAS